MRLQLLMTWAFLVAGCQDGAREGASPSRARPETLPLEAQYSGCAAVRRGPRCALPPGGRLAIWVPGAGAPKFSLHAGALEADAGAEVDGGRLYHVDVPTPAGVLTVERSEGEAVARWSLALEPHEPPAAVAAAAALRRTDPKTAYADLEAALPGLEGEAAGLARLTLGKIANQLGRYPEAIAHLEIAEASLKAAGHISGATNAVEVMAFILTDQLHQLGQANERLAPYPLMPAQWPAGVPRIAFYRNYPAAAVGDLRGALREVGRAEAGFARLGLRWLHSWARSQRAGLLRQIGRHDEALPLLTQALATIPAGAACPRAAALNNLAVAQEAAGEMSAALASAGEARQANATCQDIDQRAFIELTYATIALRLGKDEEAAGSLERVELGPGRVTLRVWSGLVRGRLALARGDAAAGLAAFEGVIEASRARGLWALHHQGLIGAARAEVAAGRADEAMRRFDAAERVVQEILQRVPVSGGRDTFVGDRGEGVREQVALLVEAGRAADALEVSRRAQARAMNTLRRSQRIEALPLERRRLWTQAIGRYRALKARLEADDWTLTAPELAAREKARPALEAQLRDVLDDAWAVLAIPSEPAALPTPRAGELLVHARAMKSGWLVFAVDERGISTQRMPALPAPDAPPSVLAAALLTPIAEPLRRARAVRFVLPGDLAARDLHALPFDGAPLGLRLPVVYGLDLPPSGSAGGRGRLIIADPRGDLAAARASVAVVAQRLEGAGPVRQLVGEAAQREAVLEAAAEVDLMHYAGHGDFGADGWSSHLRLAGQDELTASDILLLPRAPRRVVLAGCETAVAPQREAVPGMSLAHAFLLAGAEVVVATNRPVPDADSARFTEALYAALAADAAGSLPAALQAAARRHEEMDWAAWRVVAR